jgi:hypothetical protein
MTRLHRAAHVWLWLAVVAAVGCAFAVWFATQPRGEP